MLALALGACHEQRGASSPSIGAPEPEVRVARVNGVRLRYLDWGGGPAGPALVFLAGLGDSPHAYDAIAAAFAKRRRVIAIARRGHGGSDARPPYDIPTLAEDLRGVLDAAGIGRAVFVGWSMAGLEISELAARHPDRVAGVVFLDSYDLTAPGYDAVLRAYPLQYDPTPDDLATLANFRAYWRRINAPNVPWSPAMGAEVDDLVDQESDGRMRLRVSDGIQSALIAGLRHYHPRYAAIRAPLLVVWARPYTGAFLGPNAPETLRVKVQRWIDRALLPWQDSAMVSLGRLQPRARVVVLDSTGHSALPFQRRGEIVAELGRFLRQVE